MSPSPMTINTPLTFQGQFKQMPVLWILGKGKLELVGNHHTKGMPQYQVCKVQVLTAGLQKNRIISRLCPACTELVNFLSSTPVHNKLMNNLLLLLFSATFSWHKTHANEREEKATCVPLTYSLYGAYKFLCH